MFYFAPGDAIVSKEEYYETIQSGKLSVFSPGQGPQKQMLSVAFSTGNLTSGNYIPFEPIGIGKPLTIMIRQIYTGTYPRSLLGSLGSSTSMLVTSAVKSITSFEAKPRALNFLVDKVSPKTTLARPPVSSQGTPYVFYSPALIENSLTLDLSMIFDTFPQQFFTTMSTAFLAVAGIPLFLPSSTYILGLSAIAKLVGSAGEALFDGRPAFSTSEGLDFLLPGAPSVPSGFGLITDQNVDRLDPSFRENYHIDKTGQVVDITGKAYDGDVPFVVISLDGTENKNLTSFTQVAASAAILSRFYGMKEGQQQAPDTLIEAIRIYNDLNYRTRIDRLDHEIMNPGQMSPNELKRKRDERDALAKNIITDLLKKP
jgi:hypothetical protein